MAPSRPPPVAVLRLALLLLALVLAPHMVVPPTVPPTVPPSPTIDDHHVVVDPLVDALAAALDPPPATVRLSVDASPARAAETCRMRALIANEPRAWRVAGVGDLPFYDGPVARPGSLAARIRDAELARVAATVPAAAWRLQALSAAASPSLSSLAAFARFYASPAVSRLLPPPNASLDLSDVFVGAQRLSARGFSLQRVDARASVRLWPFSGPETLSDAQLAAVCGPNASLPALIAARQLFVLDLSHLARFQPAGTRKFTPAVVAHFCLERPSSSASLSSSSKSSASSASSSMSTMSSSSLSTSSILSPKSLSSSSLSSSLRLSSKSLSSSSSSVPRPVRRRHQQPQEPQEPQEQQQERQQVRQQGRRLLPLTIALVDSGLVYSRFDSAGDWALAKTALNAAETTQQQLAHFAETHAVVIPLRVELLRWLSARHPVRALLVRHLALDVALEQQAGVLLFNTSTPLDRTFGLGALGCLALVHDEIESGRAARRALRWPVDADAGADADGDEEPDAGPVKIDLHARGIDELPHKYGEYAQQHYVALERLARAFVAAFYADDAAVDRDEELQAWIQACARVRHLRGAFPQAVRSRTRLAALLARLVFLAAVKHHAMNGEATWETLAMPFSAPALWRPLPSAKRPAATLDADDDSDGLLAFLQPRERFPDLIYLSAVFNRPRAPEHSLFGAYEGREAGALAVDPRLRGALDAYVRELHAIDARIETQERDEPWPYHLLRPSLLPYNSWV